MATQEEFDQWHARCAAVVRMPEGEAQDAAWELVLMQMSEAAPDLAVHALDLACGCCELHDLELAEFDCPRGAAFALMVYPAYPPVRRRSLVVDTG